MKCVITPLSGGYPLKYFMDGQIGGSSVVEALFLDNYVPLSLTNVYFTSNNESTLEDDGDVILNGTTNDTDGDKPLYDVLDYNIFDKLIDCVSKIKTNKNSRKVGIDIKFKKNKTKRRK